MMFCSCSCAIVCVFVMLHLCSVGGSFRGAGTGAACDVWGVIKPEARMFHVVAAPEQPEPCPKLENVMMGQTLLTFQS